MNINIPGYRVIKELGSGGMATVYLAMQESVNREVALKIMAPALAADRNFSVRFLKEAKIVAELQHPNITAVFDMGVHEYHNYISMEYVESGDLKHNLENGLSATRIFSAVIDIAHALSFAHEKGYVHRDVKSENILFRADGTAVLSDFGIAKAVVSGTKMTGTGMSIGTPHYMSPEQARGQSLDGRADFYSLGVVLYEALTGSKPYDSEDTFAIGLMHINEPIPILPDEFKTYQPLIDNLCAKSPDDRYSHVNQLKQDYDAIKGGQRFKRPKHATQIIKSHASKSVSPLVWGIGGSLLAASVVMAMFFWQQNRQSEVRLSSSMKNSQAKVQSLIKEVENAKKHKVIYEKTIDEKVGEILMLANDLASKGNYIRPFGNNAKDKYLAVLAIDEVNKVAIKGLELIEKIYLQKAENAYEKKQIIQAQRFVSEGLLLNPDNDKLLSLNARVYSKNNQIISAKIIDSNKVPLNIKTTKSEYQKENEMKIDSKITVLKEAYIEPQYPVEDVRKIVKYKSKDGAFMAEIAAGEYWVGDNDSKLPFERPLRKYMSQLYYIDQYEVTVAQFKSFLNLSAYSQLPRGWDDQLKKSIKHPVEGVSWTDANAYCKYFGKRLPSELEWEIAGRGKTGKFYTWGNQFNSEGVNWSNNSISKGIAKVGTYKNDVTKSDVYDLNGNVSEWVGKVLDGYEIPIAPRDLNGRTKKMVRGGSYYSTKESELRLTKRVFDSEMSRKYGIGFRCAQEVIND